MHRSARGTKLKRKTLSWWSPAVGGEGRKEITHISSTNAFLPQDVWDLPQRWREKVRVRSWEDLQGEVLLFHIEKSQKN